MYYFLNNKQNMIIDYNINFIIKKKLGIIATISNYCC